MIIKNAKIYTMAMSSSADEPKIIENGYVKISGGLIAEVGDMKSYDATIGNENFEKSDNNIIEAGGKWLLPGFIDAHTHLGMYEDGIRNEGDDLNEVTDPCSPQLRAIDAINPMDRTFDEALSAGITCVATGPGSANPISGQFAAIKTHGKRIDGMILKEPASMKFALGENPKICYGEKNQAPETRMATAAIIRENLRKAQKYGVKKSEAEISANAENPDETDKIDEPDFDIKLESLLPVLNKEIPAHIHAHRADDIFTAIRICKEFDIDYVIVHCTDGHLIAEELAKDKVRAIVGPIICDRSKPEMKNLELKNAKILNDAGILFSLTTDHPVAPLQYLPQCAALAVKGGLDFYDAIKAITINPAVILGIDNFVGSVEKGKHADLVLYSGNPLEIANAAEIVIVGGEIVKTDEKSLQNAVVSKLREKNLTLATAESCTGGLIGKRITDVSGSSSVYLGGIISYDNSVKVKQLNVSEETLKRCGAVSEQTALEMCKGAAKNLNADIGVSTTGIAGPGGGSNEKPVGLVYVGVYYKNKETGEEIHRTVRLNLSQCGDREAIRYAAASNALHEVLKLV